MVGTLNYVPVLVLDYSLVPRSLSVYYFLLLSSSLVNFHTFQSQHKICDLYTVGELLKYASLNDGDTF